MFEKELALRKKALTKTGKVKCVDFYKTEQEKDIKKRTDLIEDKALSNKKRKVYPYRIEINVKAFDKKEREKQGLPEFDFSDKKAINKSLREEFDMPLVVLRAHNDKLENIWKYNNDFIYQIAQCNLFCDFCDVDDKTNHGKSNTISLSIKNIINTYEKVKDNFNLSFVRISGGEPFLVLDHILNLENRLEEKFGKTIIRTDTNLTSIKFVDYLIKEGELDKDILEKLAEYDLKVLACFKGSDTKGLQKNTNSKYKLDDQIEGLKILVKAGIDTYPNITNPNPESLEGFMETLMNVFGDEVLLKTHLLLIKFYNVIEYRWEKEAKKKKISYEDLKEERLKEYDSNLKKCTEILDDMVKKYFPGEYYKSVERSSIRLKVK